MKRSVEQAKIDVAKLGKKHFDEVGEVIMSVPTEHLTPVTMSSIMGAYMAAQQQAMQTAIG